MNKDMEPEPEDWCFVCKDGGNLRICDQTGCSKVYHRKCVRAKNGFLKSKELWTCRRHRCALCSTQSEMSFSCLCCTYALCDGCCTTTRGDSDQFVVVRGKDTSGLCKKCLNLVQLAEGNASEGPDGEELDFEDQDTFECRFKECWDIIKEEECLSLNDVYFPGEKGDRHSNTEDIQFCNTILGKRKSEAAYEEATDDIYSQYSDGENGNDGEDGCMRFQTIIKRRKSKGWFNGLIVEDVTSPDMSEAEFEGWGSKRLIKFLKLIGKDTTIPLPQHSVVCDIYDHIIDRHLQIAETSDKNIMVSCDYWLYCLFKMENLDVLKVFTLLEPHMENGVGVDVVGELIWKSLFERKLKKQKEDEAINGNSPIEERMFASIIPSNMKSVYLSRSLVEGLMSKEPDSWERKVVGSFVRVEIEPNDKQANSSHQLSQVTGIFRSNYSEDILRLHKRLVPISRLSNCNFTEDECLDLQEKVENRLHKRPTVVEIERKAKELREDITKNWIERELIWLNNCILQEQAEGRWFEADLLEYMKKKQKLEQPCEQERLLKQVPEVITDAIDPDSFYQYKYTSTTTYDRSM